MSNMYGYVRVSTREQNEDRQVLAMKDVGIENKKIYIDKQSGKDFNRPKYQKLIKKLKPGDVLYIKSIDRLGRNYDEILEQWRYITKEKKADIVVIDMPLLDTREKGNELTTRFVADLVLQILSFVAQTEREFIRQRQKEGIAIAKTKGVKFGRSKIALPDGFFEAKEKWENGETTVRAAAKSVGMSYTTFYYRCKDFSTAQNSEACE